MSLGEGVAAVLLGELDEPAEIGVLGRALDEQMHMVWHDAVRHDCELLTRCRSQYLVECAGRRCRVGEMAAPLKRAEREEIPLESEIGEVAKAFGTSCEHAGG
ncbi:MAG: hypothetical protein ABL982_23660, partial [Vicinamibacterales bacterium]